MILTTEQQDKAWSTLSENVKNEIRKEYKQVKKNTEIHIKEHNDDMYYLSLGKVNMLETLYGVHNLMSKPTFGIEVRMAVISHLSDAQEIGNIAIQGVTAVERIAVKREQDDHINFAKHLLIKYKDDLSQNLSEDELDELWKETCRR